MKFSKKQTLYGSVLAVAGVAYAIDAAFFGPPAGAVAAHIQSEAAPVAGAKPAAGDSAPLDGAEHLLTLRLEKWATAHPASLVDLSDAFQAPVEVKPTAPDIAPTTRPAEDLTGNFTRRHRLIAIVLNSSGGYALIDGRVLRVGQSVDDAILIGLTRRVARFSIAGRTTDMPLAADADSTK